MKAPRAAAFVAAVMTASVAVVGQQPQAPSFRSSVELTTVDVTVVDNNGKPFDDLAIDDFKVSVDGKPRRVVRADWVKLASPAASAAIPAVPEGYSTNETPTRGRLIVMAIDRPNIRPDGAMTIRPTINRFVDGLQPSDRVAVVGLGQGGISLQFTSDRALVKETIARITGIKRPISDMSQYNISLTEAYDISGASGSPSGPGNVAMSGAAGLAPTFSPALTRAFNRECLPLPADLQVTCREQLMTNSFAIVTQARNEALDTMLGLRHLLDALKTVNAPKTMIVVSEGFAMGDEQPAIVELGTMAALAQTSLYVLKLDSAPFDASQQSGSFTIASDQLLRSEGVGLLASVAKGEVFNVLGVGASAMAIVEREMSGYYLIGVESEASDRDGKAHPISVRVSRRGSIVRARRSFSYAAAAKSGSMLPAEEVVEALRLPLTLPGLPMRITTSSMRDPKTSKIQVLVHADIGEEYASGREVSLGYAVSNSKGEVVLSQTGSGRLPTAIAGVGSPLTYSTSVTLEPGEYTFKLAIAEGDRVGSVEHRVHARLVEAGGITFSELMIGGPLDPRLILAPTVGYDVRFGSVQGYLEAYGPGADSLNLRYEVARGEKDQALVDATVPGRPEGADRAVFSQALPLKDLQAGQYVLRATMSSGGKVVKSMTRSFNVAPAPVVKAPAAPNVALNVQDDLLKRPFNRAAAAQGSALQRFRETLPDGASRAFDEGTAALVSGDDRRAEERFRSALETGLAGSNNSASLAYLGAVYAASGRDGDAIGVWQAAMVDGSGFPQLYQWISEAYLRLGEVGSARSLLEEAVAKWPAETALAKPLAVIYAKQGKPAESIVLLQRYLADHTADLDALHLGVEWMSQIRAAGLLLLSRDDDAKMARAWADAYLGANGPDAENVKRWMAQIDAPAP